MRETGHARETGHVQEEGHAPRRRHARLVGHGQQDIVRRGRRSRRRRTVIGLVLAATTAATAAATTSALIDPAAATGPTAAWHHTSSYRGDVVSVKRLRVLSAEYVRAVLASTGFDADPEVIRSGVRTYRVVYYTIDPRGRRTTASGLVALPRTEDRWLQVVSYAHGTEINRADAPSTATDLEANSWGQAPALTYAAAGFAAVAPDYLGYGVGPGDHPWLDVPSETSASLDLLRAARTVAAREGRKFKRDVLVTGFSQGASAATGLGKALWAGADPSFRLGALAPVSGAYDLRSVELPAWLNGQVAWPFGVGYTAFFLVSWNRLYHLYRSPAEVFQDPKVATLFDGKHTGEQILAGLPATTGKLLTPHGFDLLRNPWDGLAVGLWAADHTCSNWNPRAPVRLFVGGADHQVPRANSEHCQAAFLARGADAPIINLGPNVGHLDSNKAGTAAVVRWFRQQVQQ
ncbi:hypothetical protein BMG523Draft_03931 [Frankia sp. BMG5.23]|nr:hypothetical protein BMG523Draft_03931 [Frankia sp. BMG5.23]